MAYHNTRHSCFKGINYLFLIVRNQKDKKGLERKIIKNDEALIPEEQDTEVDTAD